jgi:predicted N-acyltransferase
VPEFELLQGVRELPQDQWDALVGDESPFLEWSWLASLEEAGAVGPGTGWLPRPLVSRQGGRLVAACPLYVKGNSEGEFVFDWSWADAAYRAGIEYYPKLLVGVPFTPVTGRRFLIAPGLPRDEWIGHMGAALRQVVEQNDFSSAHVNFCQDEEVDPLADAGYDLRVGVQYHWHNRGYRDFEDYLGAFRSKRRNQVRRERRAMEREGVRIETLHGAEIPDALFTPMFRFYLATIDKKFYGRQYLNRRFFELVRQRFRERLCFVVASLDGEPIAGTFNVQKGDALYGRYWGADYEVRHLHFNVCYYAAIEHCILHGLQRFEPGAGGDYKQLRGFDATPTYSLHYVADPRLRGAIRRYLEQERSEAAETISWLRERSSLKGDADPSGGLPEG